MAKFSFRGKDVEQVKSLSLEDFRGLVKAKQRRSLKRGFTYDQKKLLLEIKRDPKKFHRTKARDLIIIPQMIGVRLGVYNGKEYVQLEIRPEMVGYRLGEFVLTRREVKHSAPGFGATRSSKYVPLK